MSVCDCECDVHVLEVVVSVYSLQYWTRLMSVTCDVLEDKKYKFVIVVVWTNKWRRRMNLIQKSSCGQHFITSPVWEEFSEVLAGPLECFNSFWNIDRVSSFKFFCWKAIRRPELAYGGLQWLWEIIRSGRGNLTLITWMQKTPVFDRRARKERYHPEWRRRVLLPGNKKKLNVRLHISALQTGLSEHSDDQIGGVLTLEETFSFPEVL